MSKGSLYDMPKLLQYEKDSFNHADDNAAKKSMEEKYTAIAFVQGANHSKYANLWRDLKNNMVLGQDNYPTSLPAAYDVLQNYKSTSSGGRNGGESNVRVSFLQTDRNANNEGAAQPMENWQSHICIDGLAPVPGRNGLCFPTLKCFHCNRYGHIARFCAEVRAAQNLQIGVSLTQTTGVSELDTIIPKSWILIDTGSTVSSVCSRELLLRIETCAEPIRVHSNGGTCEYNECGTLKILPIKAYFNPDSIANILSFSEVSEHFRITYDNEETTSIFVHGSDQVFEFKKCATGLYYLDTTESKTNEDVAPYFTFVQTVKENKLNFSRQELEGADKARRLQSLTGWPSTEDFKSYIHNNQILNAPITIDDINRALIVYGQHIALIKGKTTRCLTNIPKIPAQIPLPLKLLKHHPYDQINMDFLHVNKHPYLHTKSSIIKLGSIQPCKSRGKKEIIDGISKVRKMFEDRGFKINGYHGDNEFECLRDTVNPVPLYIVARGEHVGIVERSIRTIKERARCHCQNTPFRKIPKVMVDDLLSLTNSNINVFPAKNGISKTLSPGAIVLGTPKMEYNRLKLEFGTYCQIHIGTTNTMKTRTIDAIATKPASGRRGYHFMSLKTGKRVHAMNWTELPMPDYVIERVHELASREGAPEFINGGPLFEFAPGVPVDDEDEDEHDDSDNDSDEEYLYDSAEESDSDDDNNDDDDNDGDGDDSGDEDEDESSDDEDDQNNENSEDESNDDTETSDDEEEQDDLDEDEGGDPEEHVNPTQETDKSGCTEDENDDQVNNNVHQDVTSQGADDQDAGSGSRPRRSEKAKKRKEYEPSFVGKTYAQLFQMVKRDGIIDIRMMYKKCVDVIFAQVSADPETTTNAPGGTGGPQMSAKKGFEVYGEIAVAAMFKEYRQLYNQTVFGAIDPDTLSLQQKKDALRAVNLIKQKRCGKMKGRTCADGHKQRKYVSREETASPTVSTEALLATAIIDAYEKRDVTVFDIPGAYLHADYDKFVLLKLEGRFVDIMCQVNPDLKKYVRHENGKKVLYLRLLKALYGCIESALLWYLLYTETLVKLGFKLNPYDKCVANQMIQGKQCTITWYVDDNKLSHKDSKVVTEIISKIEERFPGLEITRGRKHDFLGMNMDFKDNGTVAIHMKDHIKEAIELFEEIEKIDTQVSSPANGKLFEVNDDAVPLEGKKKEVFHSVVAKVLFIMKRARPDMELTNSFLCTRVSRSTKEDWAKLKRAMAFMKQTIDDVRIIGADSLEKLLVWIDGSHAVHKNMRGHTGGSMSYGIGQVHSRAGIQKANTKSSTETEVVATSEYIPYPMHMANFMKEQGYPVKIKLYQDNQSAIKMEKNGRNSCTGNSRHIKIRYFFVKDLVDKGEVEIVYCPTEQMLADYFTKPLQGELFRRFRKVIMGWDNVDILKQYLSQRKPRSKYSSKERVGGVEENVDLVFQNKSPKSYTDIVKTPLTKNGKIQKSVT